MSWSIITNMSDFASPHDFGYCHLGIMFYWHCTRPSLVWVPMNRLNFWAWWPFKNSYLAFLRWKVTFFPISEFLQGCDFSKNPGPLELTGGNTTGSQEVLKISKKCSWAQALREPICPIPDTCSYRNVPAAWMENCENDLEIWQGEPKCTTQI